MENILLIRLKSIGDIVFTLPAVDAVRQNFPKAKLHFLISREHASLLRGFAEIDHVIPLDRDVYHSGKFISAAAGTVKLLHKLRREKFSVAIDLQGFGETEWLSWWTGAPERFGHIYPGARGWTYTCGLEVDEQLPPAERHLRLLKKGGLRIGEIHNEFILPDDAATEAKKFFVANQLNSARPTLFLQPFTSSSPKNWPLENYVTLAKYFQSQGGQIIFGGGPADRAKLESLKVQNFVVAAGLPLLVAAGLTKLSTLVIGGDTGLLHLAVAQNRRVIMLMQAGALTRTQPIQHPDWAIPAPKNNLARIEIETVINAAAPLLAHVQRTN
jgi:ADP-heptose:LPS heptosyltransferase